MSAVGRVKSIKRPAFEKEPSGLFDWVDALVSAVVIIIVLFSLIFRVTGVRGYSMESTLYEGDSLIISKLFFEPRQGDIVVISKKSFQEEAIVKRIVAVSGQRVDIDRESGRVYVDGEEEHFSPIKVARFGDVDFPVVVPEGCVFVMGDNRNESTDSRYKIVGFIDERQILGRAVFRIYPFNRIGDPG